MLSCFTLTPQFIQYENSTLKTLKLFSCEIPNNDACDALVRFLQSSHCVLETIEFNSQPLVESTTFCCEVPNEILKGIGSICSRTLKLCFLNDFCFLGNI